MSNVKIPRTKYELFTELKTQLQFLQDECDKFDTGCSEYSKRIALTLRILLYDTKNSKSVLQQVEQMFCYNRPDFIDISTTHGALNGEGVTNFVRSSMCIYQFDHYIDSPPILQPKPIRIKPNTSYPRRAFKTWWEGLHITLIDAEKFLSRKDVVTLLADTDGGAHIDPKLDERLILLKRKLSNPLKISVPMEGGTKVYTAQTDQILAANIRSIAEEVLFIFHSVLHYCESKL